MADMTTLLIARNFAIIINIVVVYSFFMIASSMLGINNMANCITKCISYAFFYNARRE
jgi:hypothetical protein